MLADPALLGLGRGVNEIYVCMRNLLQPAAQQVERVQRSDGYGRDVWWSNLLQSVAQQLERVQREGYGSYVCRRKVLQPAAQ